jgi:predicted unusual protein kinase regulating ubiquinone biosynthesis (AarF/ABC1/UbiB family)
LDNTPPRPFSEVEYSIRQELLRSPQGPSFPKDKNALVPLGVVFSHVEKIPIAAASIAQVMFNNLPSLFENVVIIIINYINYFLNKIDNCS